MPFAVDSGALSGAVPLGPLWPRRSFGPGAGFLRRSVAHLRRYSRQRAPDGTKHNGLAPRRENWQNRQDLQAVGKDLAKVGHLPMSPTSKPRHISGTRARGLCPNKSRATLPGKNRWAEHCPCYAIAPNLRNTRRSKRHLVLDLKGRWPPPPSPKHPWHLPQR